MAKSAASVVIRKTVTVAVPVETAFRIFTEEVGSWWPLATKSVGQQEAETLVIEPREGGRVYERVRGGEEHDWGVILAWEPPRRLAFTWHPGRGPETGQEVEVRFDAASGCETLVELEHRGWERLVETAEEIPEHYESGWEEVLRRYVEAATGAGARAGT
jgi:uncharacterized protein YndB with AHSA1/START domain